MGSLLVPSPSLLEPSPGPADPSVLSCRCLWKCGSIITLWRCTRRCSPLTPRYVAAAVPLLLPLRALHFGLRAGCGLTSPGAGWLVLCAGPAPALPGHPGCSPPVLAAELRVLRVHRWSSRGGRGLRAPPLPGRSYVCGGLGSTTPTVALGLVGMGSTTLDPTLAAGAVLPASLGLGAHSLCRLGVCSAGHPRCGRAKQGQAPPWASRTLPAPPTSARFRGPGPGACPPQSLDVAPGRRSPWGPSPPGDCKGPGSYPETFCPLPSVGTGK